MISGVIRDKTVVYSTSPKRDKRAILKVVSGSDQIVKSGTTLGQYLGQARQAAGLSIRQLAEVANVPKTIVGRLELDQIQSPKPDQLTRLAQALEVGVSDLFLLGGIQTPAAPPSVEALLRSEYDLPDAALVEAKKQIAAIITRHARKQANRKEEQ